MKAEKIYTKSTKGEKIFRAVNIALTVGMMLAGVALAIYYKVARGSKRKVCPKPWNAAVWAYSACLRAYCPLKIAKLSVFDFQHLSRHCRFVGKCAFRLQGFRLA